MPSSLRVTLRKLRMRLYRAIVSPERVVHAYPPPSSPGGEETNLVPVHRQKALHAHDADPQRPWRSQWWNALSRARAQHALRPGDRRASDHLKEVSENYAVLFE